MRMSHITKEDESIKAHSHSQIIVHPSDGATDVAAEAESDADPMCCYTGHSLCSGSLMAALQGEWQV